MIRFKVFVVALILSGCGGVLPRGRGNPQVWVQNCAEACRDSVYDVRILERDGNESRTKVALISMSPPYVCRCDRPSD